MPDAVGRLFRFHAGRNDRCHHNGNCDRGNDGVFPDSDILYGFHTTSSEVEQLHFIQWTNTLPERETLPYIEGNGGNFDSYSICYAIELLSKAGKT